MQPEWRVPIPRQYNRICRPSFASGYRLESLDVLSITRAIIAVTSRNACVCQSNKGLSRGHACRQRVLQRHPVMLVTREAITKWHVTSSVGRSPRNHPLYQTPPAQKRTLSPSCLASAMAGYKQYMLTFKNLGLTPVRKFGRRCMIKTLSENGGRRLWWG